MKGRLFGSVRNALSPKRRSNTIVMNRWSADETVVAIKRLADEGMVTCLRGKLTENDMDERGEGWNMLTRREPHYKLSC